MPQYISNGLLIIAVMATVATLMFYLRIGWLIHLLERVKLFNKAIKYVQLLESFSIKQLLTILALSFLRYGVFILQYMLLLKVMGVEVGYGISFLLLSVFYLVMAIAPTVGLAELPVRASASVELFKLFSDNIVGVQAAALGIWIINLVLPAVIGSILIFGIKITKDDA